ncbi:hypothetical protein GIB67_041612 [Kingdonia uniflora]|uniref:Helicase ATP-binding domain-containing protein n=1 Tax=Kingdonia uniflora TaxID=39325 RepID=A0A7J7MQI9_9MAGN|nr:hypothetical protein GIB67_041612 [Kingdonia uniflora]
MSGLVKLFRGDTMDQRNLARNMTLVQIDIARKAKRVAENLGTTNNLNPRVRKVVLITFATWYDAEKEFRDRLWTTIKQKFIVPEEAIKLALMTMGKDWREHIVQKRKVIDIEDDLEQALDQIDAGEVDLIVLSGPECIGRVKGFDGELLVKKAIIVTPTSLVSNWESKIKKWVGERVRLVALCESSGDDIICGIDSFIRPRGPFQMHSSKFDKSGSCDLLICGEAHRLKNDQTLTNRALAALSYKRRILLSGTPMQARQHLVLLIDLPHQTPIVCGREPTATKKKRKLGDERSAELSAKMNQGQLSTWRMLYGMDIIYDKGLVIVADNFRYLYSVDMRSNSQTGEVGLIHKKGTKVVRLQCNPLQPNLHLICGNDHFARLRDMHKLGAESSPKNLPHGRVVNSAYFFPHSGSKNF